MTNGTANSSYGVEWVAEEDDRPATCGLVAPPDERYPELTPDDVPPAAAAVAACRAGPGDPTLHYEARQHEARGLLNLIALVGRCLDTAADASDEDLCRWAHDIDEAARRLERLCRAGLGSDQLTHAARQVLARRVTPGAGGR